MSEVRMDRGLLHIITVITGLGLLGTERAEAQGPLSTIRVHVTDSAGTPIRDADVAVTKPGADLVLLGRTDAAGRYTFRFAPDTGTYGLAARRPGYAAASRPFAARPRDTLAVELSLARLPPSLDTVRAQAERLPLAKQPFVGAEEIERDTRGIFNLGDLLKKLRPDINYQGCKCLDGRTAIIGRGSRDPQCPPPRVYANGKWIFRMPGFNPLTEIRSEHILELHLVTCFDTSVPGLPSKPWASIYITLKSGVAVDLKHGSYVVDDSMYAAAERERLGRTVPPR